MSIQDWGAIGEIIGAIAVIVTLIYLATQIRQNTAVMRAESRNAIHHSHQQELFRIVESPDIWRSFSDEDLDDENIRLIMWLIAHMRAREHEWFQLQQGALDQAAWNSYSMAIPLVLATEHCRAWWKVMKPTFDKGFAEAVDKLLENEDLSAFQFNQAKAIQRAPDQ